MPRQTGTSDNGDPMATLSDHLTTKWKRFFQFFDLNKDGYWSQEDFTKFADKVITQADSMMTDIGASHIKRYCQHWLSIHEEQLCRTLPGQITEQILCKAMTEVLQHHPRSGHQIKALDIFGEAWFDILDISRNGRISEADMRVVYRCMGVKDLATIGELFNSLDLDRDHHLTREEVRVGYRQYFFGDQRKSDDVKALLFDISGLQKNSVLCLR